MKIENWKDCPCCGLKNTMRPKRNFTKKFEIKGYEPFTISSLDGSFCSKCSMGFYSDESRKRVNDKFVELRGVSCAL